VIYSDNDILIGFAARDERIFEAIYIRYYPLVYGICRKIYDDTQDCEDNSIMVFTYLFSCETLTFDSISSLAGYLCKAARNKSFNTKRDKHRRAEMSLNIPEDQEWGIINNELDYQYIRAMSIIKKAMSCYPTRGVQVLHMIYFEEKTHIQIAEELGISLRTVPNLRVQGLDYLLKRLSK
jgi:RNA polymerase sigma factor (sigma-70 family)